MIVSYLYLLDAKRFENKDSDCVLSEIALKTKQILISIQRGSMKEGIAKY